MNITELKARAYDLISLIGQAQRELQEVNKVISQTLAEQAKVDNVETTKKALHEKTTPNKSAK